MKQPAGHRGFEMVQQDDDEFCVAQVKLPHSGALSSSSTAETNMRTHDESLQPLLQGPDAWSKRTRIIRISKVVSFICIGLLVGATLAAFSVNFVRQRAAAASGAGELTPQQRAEVNKGLPPGVQLTIPPGAGEPLRKKPRDETQPPGYAPILDPRVNYTTFLKPAYHLTSDTGWMNDPNGMFQAVSGPSGSGPGDKGPVHVFYQYNPQAPVWGSPWWGHVMSWDLVKWIRLPPALKPDTWYDRDGVFSGSATVMPDGRPIMLYTAVMNFSQYGFYYQTQAMAVPSNLSDPYLIDWDKSQVEGMNIPPGGTHAQFRDPVTAWQVPSNEVAGLMPVLNISKTKRKPLGDDEAGDAGVWMTAVGVLDDCVGAASLYVTQDNSLRSWSYAGTLFSQLAQNMTRYSVCLPKEDLRDQPEVPSGARGYGSGRCDQFGEHCRMWECPDFFTLDSGVQVFKYSDQSRRRYPFAADYYLLGDAHLLNYTRAWAQDGEDAFAARLQGSQYKPRELDYGSVYASKSFRLSDGRRVWLGWVYEDSIGCTEVCGDGTPFIRETQGWQGAQTLLRHITYDNASRALRFTPVHETHSLRRTPALLDSKFTLNTHAAAAAGRPAVHSPLLPERAPGAAVAATPQGAAPTGALPGQGSEGVVSLTQGRQLEVRLSFSLDLDSQWVSSATLRGIPSVSVTWPVRLGLRVMTGNGTFTDIILSGTVALVDEKSLRDPAHVSKHPHRAASRVPAFKSLTVAVHRNASGGMTSPVTQRGAVPLPQQGLHAQDINLTVYVDRSVWEVYALDGLAVVTTRVYPLPFAAPASAGVGGAMVGDAELGSWGYTVLAQWEAGVVRTKAEVYDMDSCWADGGSVP